MGGGVFSGSIVPVGWGVFQVRLYQLALVCFEVRLYQLAGVSIYFVLRCIVQYGMRSGVTSSFVLDALQCIKAWSQAVGRFHGCDEAFL